MDLPNLGSTQASKPGLNPLLSGPCERVNLGSTPFDALVKGVLHAYQL